MIRFEKTVLIILAVILTVCFAGCSDKAETADETNQKITITDEGKSGLKEYKKESSDSGESSSPEVSAPVSDSKAKTYCANKSSMRFHLSDCTSVKKMKPENRYETNDRNELIEAGYTPCSVCNP